jgi:proteic killer suppression protein
MIRSFKDTETELIFRGQVSRRLPGEIQTIARRKLVQLETATSLLDLKDPPGNRLEALKGERRGQYSIRINEQWRICFRWEEGPSEVEIVDYH